MYYRLKPKIIQTETMTIFPNDEYEQVTLAYCPKHEHGDAQCWQTENCCGCRMASWRGKE